jgi:replicative DNA helicase
MIPESLYSVQLERNSIGGFLNFPDTLIDLSNFLSDDLYYTKEHRIIFSILKNAILNGERIEKILIAKKIKDLGIRMDIDIFDYIDSIGFCSIQPSGIEECIKELLKLKIRRDIYNNAAAIQKYIKESNNDPIDKIISSVDGIYNSQINLLSSSENEPVDLYAGIEDLLKKIANNPINECGLITPFKQFNEWFGGLLSGDGIYTVSGLSGQGKSAYLFNMAKGVAKLNNCKCLILDTEMSLTLNQFRAASAETQTQSWYLKTGNWIKNTDLSNKVIKGIDKLNQYKGCVYHMYVPNKDIQEIISIGKRWFYKHVKRGEKAIIVYDYLKIVENLEKNRSEWQALGDRVSYLNEMGHQLNIPILTGAQQNRTALEQGGARRDDHTTVGGSDRINQYSCFNSIFREKTQEELQEQGTNFGTHLLIPIKTSRNQGKNDYDRNKNVRIVDTQTNRVKYKRNFINYEISMYEIFEKGTYSDIIQNQQLNANLQKDNDKGKITYNVSI